MRRITVINHLSLDGVMQAPGRRDEDTRDGFEHGGWAQANSDEVMGRKMAEGMAQEGALLLGRRTYEDFYGYWPKQTDNPFTPVLDATTKYVVSTTLTEPLPWQNSVLLRKVDAVAELDGNVTVLGSGELVRSLAQRDLIDAYLLMIHPLILGNGRRMFAGDAPYAKLRLTDSITTTTGVMIATYERP